MKRSSAWPRPSHSPHAITKVIYPASGRECISAQSGSAGSRLSETAGHMTMQLGALC